MLTNEIQTRLEALGLIDSDFELYRGTVPAKPDNVVALFETGGTGQSDTFDGVTVDQPGLMIVVRGQPHEYDIPRLQMEQLYQAICAWGAFTVDGVRYMNLSPLQAPFPRGRDENQRQEFGVNFLVMKGLSDIS